MLTPMETDGIARLERVMQHGFETLAALQRETNQRLDQTNARLERVENEVKSLNVRVEVIERVLEDFAAQLLTLARAVKHLAETQDEAIGDLRRRVEQLERRTGA
jgi:archaellum component FlaC